MTLSSLIERLEKAEGASRELDVAVAEASGWQRRESAHGVYWIAPHGEFDVVPPYTSSIDAALTFVPEGSQWTIEADTAWVRQLSATDVDEFQGGFFCRGGTCTAIAICIAALRAQAAIEGGGNG